MLGGSSSLNAMIYLRGFPEDYDKWLQLGNTDWGSSSVWPVFDQIENNMATNRSATDQMGPVKIDYTYSIDQVRHVIATAAKEQGYPWVPEFNQVHQVGYTNVITTTYKGIRQSAARSYLVPVAKRKNLRVVKFSQVTNLVIRGNKVIGVDFVRNKRSYTVRARKEVILSAGAINTPKILMLSGIGPKKHLNKLEIPIVSDLPVGRHLQDHVMVPIFLSIKNYPFNQGLTMDQNLDTIYAYLKGFAGPLAETGLDFIGMINTKQGPVVNQQDIEILHIVMEPSSTAFGPLLKQQRYQDHHIKELVEVNKNSTTVMFIITLSHPKSKGKTELQSKDPMAPPNIFPNYLDVEDDVQTLARALKSQYELEQTQTMQAVNGKFHFFEDMDCPSFPSLKYFECYARQLSSTLFHPVGTARMGPDSDKQAVVSPLLRVRGVRRLRVCDASVIPEIPSVNTNAAVMMIGERCAEFVKERYQND